MADTSHNRMIGAGIPVAVLVKKPGGRHRCRLGPNGPPRRDVGPQRPLRRKARLKNETARGSRRWPNMTTGKGRRAAGTRYVLCPPGSPRPPDPLPASTPCGRSAQPSALTLWNPGGIGRVGFTSDSGAVLSGLAVRSTVAPGGGAATRAREPIAALRLLAHLGLALLTS